MNPSNLSAMKAFVGPADWKVLEFRTPGQDLEVLKYPDYRSLGELVRLPGRFHMVGIAERPGLGLFGRRLEVTYFAPGTPRNQDFGYRAVIWEELMFIVITIPERTRRFAERVAARLRLRFADGVPTILDGSGPPKFFPMRGSSVWTIEYAPGFPPPDFNPADEQRLVEDLERTFKATGRN